MDVCTSPAKSSGTSLSAADVVGAASSRGLRDIGTKIGAKDSPSQKRPFIYTEGLQYLKVNNLKY